MSFFSELRKRKLAERAAPVPAIAAQMPPLPPTVADVPFQPPAVCASTLPAPSPAAPLPAVQASKPELAERPVTDYSTEDLALRDEKVEFVRAVLDYKRTHWKPDGRKVSLEDAVKAIADLHEEDFPRLRCGGKKGASMLTAINFRNWTEGTGKKPRTNGLIDPLTGKVDFTRKDVLLPKYGCTERENPEPGDPAFWAEMRSVLFNEQHCELAKAYRVLELEWQLSYPGMQIPKLHVIRYRFKKLYPERMVQYFRKGENWYDQHVRLSAMRDPRTIRPNEAWVADTQDCDFIIRIHDENGAIQYIRPKICVIIDVKSQHMISIQLVAGQVTNEHIRAALAWGVAHFGRPRIFLTDNGRDYLKQGFATPVVFTPAVSGSELFEHSILRSLDIEHHLARKYNGRSKYVERFFEELAKYSCLARGYIGNKPENRPAAAAVWMKPGNREYLWDEEKACRFLGAMIDLYHRTPKKTSRFLNGLSPDQAFAPDIRYKRADMTLDEYLRAFQMPEPKHVIVDQRGPSVRCGNMTYVADHEERMNLWPYDKKPVMLKFDLGRRDYCYAWSLDGKYLCRCSVPELLPYFDAPREQLQAAMRRINADVAFFNSAVREITGNWHLLDPATVFKQPREALLEKAPLHLLDSRYSVKGEKHNPKIYIAKNELKSKTEQSEKQTVCTKTQSVVTPHNNPGQQPKSDPELAALVEKALTGAFEPADANLFAMPEITGNEEKETFKIPTIKEKTNDNKYELPDVF